ncbi:hypothetical protein HD806DRAFT_543377 [Xylariaceae sp. AK1471]|nr:hypothetical protein HD806DRAFT_543377 [Xylariaceae sp. AK1471]
MDYSHIPQPPVLVYTTGQVSQTNFHKKPAHPSAEGGSGPEHAVFPKSLKPPAEFGKLSTKCKTLRCPRVGPSEGYHDYVFCRSDGDAGEVAQMHGIDRDDGDKFDRAQYNPLYHQELRSYANYDGAKLTREEKRIRDIAVHYPNIVNGIMKAPFFFRAQTLTKPQAEQPAAFTKVLAINEISNLIIQYLVPRHGDLTNLFRACQFTAGVLQSKWMHLDASTNNFMNFDKWSLAAIKREANKAEKKGEAVEAKLLKEMIQGFSPYCIISPVRPQEQGPLQKRVINEFGYPVTSKVEKSEETDFQTSMKSQYQLFHLAWNNGHMLTHLVLHGLPWLNVAALKSMIPVMPRLQAIAVHQCFLMNFGDTQDLLEEINCLNRDRKKLQQPHVAADFTPFYYRGPPYKADGTGHIGEYGLHPEELEWVDTTRAATAQLIKIWDLCQNGDQDFFTPGTGFRSFLERLPFRLHALPTILRCIAAIHGFNAKYRSGERYESVPVILNDVEDAMETTLLWDLIVACNGRPMLLGDLKLLVVLRGRANREKCCRCRMRMPAYFFQGHMLRRQAQHTVCHGCQLGAVLKTHAYRLQKDRRALSNSIFHGKNWDQDNSLEQVIRNIAKPATPNTPAITSKADKVDINMWKEARKIWVHMTTNLPDMLKVRLRAIEFLELKYPKLKDYEDQERNCEKRAQLEKDVLSIQFQLGEIQRNRYDESVNRLCRSWETNIREYRAELAWQNGNARALIHTGRSMISWDVKPNLAALLGATGGLADPDGEADSDDQYEWTCGGDDADHEDEKQEQFAQPHDGNDVSMSSGSSPDTPTRHSTSDRFDASSWSNSNNSPASTNTSLEAETEGRSTSATDGSEEAGTISWADHIAATSGWSSRQGGRESQFDDDVPTAAKAERAPRYTEYVPPHRRAIQQGSVSTQQVPAQQKPTYAAAASTQATPSRQGSTRRTTQSAQKVPPHLRHTQPVAQSPQQVLPHQRRTYATAVSTQPALPHQTATQQTTVSSRQIPPHLRRPT